MPYPRISAISFLNTAPLMWDFERTELRRAYDVSYTIPSLCAEALHTGKADVGLIPAVTYLTIPDLLIIPDVAIAARGAVRSILLVSRKPLEKVKTVATDTSSRTSVVLCDLLFRRWFAPLPDGARVRAFARQEPELEAMLVTSDAALLIGDSALRVDRTRYNVVDLAEEWHAMTGKAFCFAFWAVRAGAATTEMAEHFRVSRDHGLQSANLDLLAREWAPRVGISEADVRSYLSASIFYSLNDEVLAGLESFLGMAAEEGLLPKAPPLRFVAEPARPRAAGLHRS